MRILVVGSGGREHALAWKLAQSPSVDTLFAAPGNPGMAALGTCVPIAVDDLTGLADFAERGRIDLTVVGPEVPLVAGLTDELTSRGLKVFGPSKAAAQLEGSKAFTQDVAARHGVPIAFGETFDDADRAIAYVKAQGAPIVVKADGLAAGKGVRVCASVDEAVEAINGAMRDGAFGVAGAKVVIQECLDGREASLFCLTDGRDALVLEPAQDYKRSLDDDLGPNTGGMGSYSPVPWLDESQRDLAVKTIIEPLLHGMAADGVPYAGCLYAGVFFTSGGPKLYEINCRFGDPETQVHMPRLQSDLAELLLACADGTLSGHSLDWSPDAAVCVVLAAGGYELDPSEPRSGLPITGLPSEPGVVVFHAGTAIKDGALVSSGGRVLNVVATAPTHELARTKAYDALGRIELADAHFRTDIAKVV